MAGNSTDAGRSVTQKITSILMAFTEGSEHSLTEIAHLAALQVSTAHRLTTELVSCHLLIRTAHARATRVAVTRCELEANTCTVAVPVLGPGGGVLAAIELTVPDLGYQLRAVLGVLAIAARSLSRELTRALPAPDQTQAHAGAD